MRNHSNASPIIQPSNPTALPLSPSLPSLIKGVSSLAPKLTLTPITNSKASSNTIQMLLPHTAARLQVEGFIKKLFTQHHNATVSSFSPLLFAGFSTSDQPQSALGLRNASQESLYLEHYLDEGIETLIQSVTGEAVERKEIVEIGNLASQNSASCKALFAYITGYLDDQDVKWITCTGTAVLRVVFKRLGIRAVTIHEADQNRLGDEQYAWGSYYLNDPQVMLINVQETHHHFIRAKSSIANEPVDTH